MFILPHIYYESVSLASPFVFINLVSDLSNSCEKNRNVGFVKHELSTVKSLTEIDHNYFHTNK